MAWQSTQFSQHVNFNKPWCPDFSSSPEHLQRPKNVYTPVESKAPICCTIWLSKALPAPFLVNKAQRTIAMRVLTLNEWRRHVKGFNGHAQDTWILKPSDEAWAVQYVARKQAKYFIDQIFMVACHVLRMVQYINAWTRLPRGNCDEITSIRHDEFLGGKVSKLPIFAHGFQVWVWCKKNFPDETHGTWREFFSLAKYLGFIVHTLKANLRTRHFLVFW